MFLSLFEGAINENPSDLSTLLDERSTHRCAKWVVLFRKEAHAVLEKALSPARLQSAAQKLPLGDEFWNSPLVRVGRYCLLVYYGTLLAFGIKSDRVCPSPRLSKSIVDWICLLSTPDASTGSNSLDLETNDSFALLLFGIGTISPHGHDAVYSDSSDAARAVVALLLSTCDIEKDSPVGKECGDVFELLYSTMCEQQSFHQPDAPPPAKSIWYVLTTWESRVAHAVMRALNSAVGRLTGNTSLPLPPNSDSVFGSINSIIALPSMRRALLCRGLVPSLCLAARKVVRGEIEDQENAKSILLTLFKTIIQFTFRPEHMREALNAHLVATILRVPGIETFVDPRTDEPYPVPEDRTAWLGMLCTDTLSRMWTYAAFPSLFASMDATVRHIDGLVARGIVTIDGDHRGSVFTQYAHLRARVEAVRRGEVQYPVKCHNPACPKTQIVGRCSRCKVAGYCSRKCQREHREAHETRCYPTLLAALLYGADLFPFDIRDMAVVLGICTRALRDAIRNGMVIDDTVKSVVDNPSTIYHAPVIVIDLKTSTPDVKVEVCRSVCERSTNIIQLKITMEVVASMLGEMKVSESPIVIIMFGTWMSLLSNHKALGV
ncbi:hypothetical protein CYLTODRAFT_426336 [Cylindrobasidium torrendii FP15055 ss-10]|uniref:MYND-type domain-containing protein n=1 Tax=Cylindrobasidium torrendii FP15055 ss-10 TaxID=1314674 RepID=A0A0D7AY31_9AGAR|nr:hypothetical protein CYLTODRAFT_426336 [Cylindrobasidium torrendii FP15055 ss-10]